jgi:hypothetical protein
MKRIPLILTLCLGIAVVRPIPSWAQETTPEGELFVGVSKFTGESAFSEFVCVGASCMRVTTQSIRIPYDSGGADFSITGNINRFAGLEANVNCCKRPDTLSGKQLTLSGGPRFVYRKDSHLNPFAHVLLGLTHGRQATPDAHSRWRGGFATILGGGVDVKVTRYLWVRAFQLDFVRESFRDDVQRSSKLSFGIVFRFRSLSNGAAKNPANPRIK